MANNKRVLNKTYTRETLKEELLKHNSRAILAGNGNYWYNHTYHGKRSAAPVTRKTLETLEGRSKWSKNLLVDAIVAKVFGDDLPEGARVLTKEEKTAKRKADAAKKEAARIAMAKEAMKFKPPKGPLKDLTEEQARYLSKMVMAHPGGCDSGKREFITRLGLPDPPVVATISVSVTVPVNPLDVTTDSYQGKIVTRDAKARIQKEIRDALPENSDATFGTVRVSNR